MHNNKLKTSFSRSTPFPNAIIKNSRDMEILQKYNVLTELKHVKVDLGKRWEDEIKCIETVLEECPHLKFLENSEFISSYRVMKKCVETGKNGSLTLSNINIEFCNTSAQTIEKFIISGVKVINLRICNMVNNEDINIKMPNLIQKILHSSKDCLKTLDFPDSSFSLTKNFPVMPQLESLCMTIKIHGISGLPMAFPHGFRFDTNCPNLKRFNISFHHNDVHNAQHFIQAVLASTGPARSVKDLNIIFTGQVQLSKICETFSDIVKLDILSEWRSVVDLTPVWETCRNLKAITVKVPGFKVPDVIDLLAQMTGHSKDYINSVWNSSVAVKIHPLPGQPSLLNLQDLENLTFQGGFMVDVNTKFLNLLRSFALPYMPKLKKIE